MGIERIFEVIEGGVFKDVKGNRIYSAYDLKLIRTPQIFSFSSEIEDAGKYLEEQIKEGKIKAPVNANAYLISEREESMQYETGGKDYIAYTVSFFIIGIIEKEEKK